LSCGESKLFSKKRTEFYKKMLLTSQVSSIPISFREPRPWQNTNQIGLKVLHTSENTPTIDIL